MIDKNALAQYDQFLESIPAKRKLHYLIADSEFQSDEGFDVFYRYNSFYFKEIEKYRNYPSNTHHWTTRYAWEEVIPKLLNDLCIYFDTKRFSKVINLTEGEEVHDLTYHKPIDSFNYKLIHADGSIISGDHDAVLRCKTPDGGWSHDAWTQYHALFRDYHRCCTIINEHEARDINRVLLLNADSMSIPLIPILAYYFGKIYVLDNRTNTAWFEANVNKEEITDYVALGLKRSYSYSETFLYRETSNNKIFIQNIK